MARAFDKNYFLMSEKFKESHKELYNTTLEAAAERYSALTEGLIGDVLFFSSSGRSELIGNHTDHNHGFVLAATVDLDTAAAVVKTNDDNVTVNSVGYPPVVVSTSSLDVDKSQYGTSDALVKGVLKGFLNRGYKVGGFVANTDSNIFKGAGVSSSAAFELLVCEILNTLYNDKKIGADEKAIISQYAENVYFGKPSGLMDQLTISRGNVSFMDFRDTANPVSETIEWNFDNLALVIVNCGGDHCNLTHEYTEIREDMTKVSEYFGQKALREVDSRVFENNYAKLLETVGGRAVLRAKHFFEENGRVLAAVDALREKNEKAFLRLITASGYSSKEQLQNCFAKTDAEQRLMFGLKIAEDVKEVRALRVHGGGFAGTMLAMLDKSEVAAYKSAMSGIFGEENVFELSIRKKGTTQVEA